MSKSLINILGAVVCVGLLVLGVVLLVVPQVGQAQTVAAQTAVVDQTNDLYQVQVDALREAEQRFDEIQASVADLRAEIPETNRLDDVFELIAEAATAANSTIVSITAGEATEYVERTEALAIGEVPEAPAEPEAPAAGEESTGDTTTDATSDGADTGEATTAPQPAPTSGAVQVDFVVSVTATQFSDVVRFLDALRAGPRLFSTIDTVVNPNGPAFTVNLTGLTFVYPEE
jgi:TolA-binding protein